MQRAALGETQGQSVHGRHSRFGWTARKRLVETHETRHGRVQGMIAAHVDVLAWVPLCAALAHNDISGYHGCRSSTLHTQAATCAVAIVLGGTATTLG